MDLVSDISQFFKGDIENSAEVLKKYSTDASLLSVTPEIIVFPKDVEDIKQLVSYVSAQKEKGVSVSITARAAGTCMSGGSLNESIIIDTQRYMSGVVSMGHNEATVLPGTLYRDFEKQTLSKGLLLPSYTASKSICAIGGMVMNNAGGEKTLAYGKTEQYIKQLKIVFSDGNEYTIVPLNKRQLAAKKRKKTFEGQLYTQIAQLIKDNERILADAKPQVSKNSAGYYLWNVWREDGTFDLNRLLVGSQGTLGILTEVTFSLVKVKSHSKLFVVFLKDLADIPELVKRVLPYKPESIESYDDHTFKMAMKFLPSLIKQMNVKNFFRFAWSFWPEVRMILTGGLPKLVVLIEFASDSMEDIEKRIASLKVDIADMHLSQHIAQNKEDTEKYWTMRRESFNLLRKHVHGKRTAPFIDDFIVRPEYLPEFMPQLDALLGKYPDLVYTIAGHIGDGNFHIIPLMDMHIPQNKQIIVDLSKAVYDLVIGYNGSITAEHNDGIIRTPFLSRMYGDTVVDLFKQTKDVFDPLGIFNPGKKVGGSFKYIEEHIAQE